MSDDVTAPLESYDEDVFVDSLEDPAKKYAGMMKKAAPVAPKQPMAPMPEDEELLPPQFFGSKLMWLGLFWVTLVAVVIVVAVRATQSDDPTSAPMTMAPTVANATVIPDANATEIPDANATDIPATPAPTAGPPVSAPVATTMAPTVAATVPPVATTMDPTDAATVPPEETTMSPTAAATVPPVATTLSPTAAATGTPTMIAVETGAPTMIAVATGTPTMIEVATGAPTETLLEATVEPTTAPVAATDVPATDAPVAETGAPTIAITQPPTILTEAPTVPLTLIDYLPDYSVEAILNPTSPQAFALLFVNYDVNIDTRTPEQLVQRFALATLYFALGRSWTQGSVLPSEEECTWFEDTGSYCNEDGFQEGLLLENNNLEDGPIPPEIGLLTSLKVVDMSDNEIVGDIPTYFGQLTILETLRLARNERLMGTVPTELENIPTLQELDLSGLEFVTGTIPEGLCDVPNLLFDCSPTLCGCDSCQCEAPQ